MTDFWQTREGFWNRGGWWKALLVTVAYLAVFLGISQLVGLTLGHLIDDGGPLASATNVLLELVLPIGLGALVIVLFLAAIGWLKPVLGRQPIGGRPWMWIAVAVVAYPIILRLIGLDYGSFPAGVVLVTLLAGLVIGIAEELVTRGAGVALLRKGGYSERMVAVLSSVLFAMMHLINAIGTGISLTIIVLLVYTFFFGICMYLIMRVTGSIVWAILAHALTDPMTILSTGGVDTAVEGAQNVWLTVASTGNYAVIIFGIVALFLIRGRVNEAGAAAPATTTDPATA
ncbi:CPBP family intramembrane metalloprotease [Microbacterium sp. kSW2-24]|uniref:CPBP family intramembrane glutamic endopeptidase n=1 Tax=Microbacterium galbinum TaxID=2851646 RepID=UPI001FFCB69B|nr:CPBP family intramembrane glutamic endopeptidase [Microbacterium galbinum]MCK2023940.1 CPBP family intramembrane metalloprotease [Microbacterium galbinum]